jgi:hypothetical protein
VVLENVGETSALLDVFAVLEKLKVTLPTPMYGAIPLLIELLFESTDGTPFTSTESGPENVKSIAPVYAATGPLFELFGNVKTVNVAGPETVMFEPMDTDALPGNADRFCSPLLPPSELPVTARSTCVNVPNEGSNCGRPNEPPEPVGLGPTDTGP